MIFDEFGVFDNDMNLLELTEITKQFEAKEQDYDDVIIGIIDFDDNSINEQEIVSSKEKKLEIKPYGPCKVHVYSKEGDKPHLHIIDASGKFDCCVRIYSIEYFSHGPHQSKFSTTKQCVQFNEWMKQLNFKFGNGAKTNWEVAKDLWEISNPNCRFQDKFKVTIQPDYSKLNNK